MIKKTPIEKWVVETGKLDKAEPNKPNRQTLEKYQLEKIGEMVEYTKKSGRFYGEYFQNIKADEIRTFQEFQKLPFTYPEQVRDNPLHFLCVPQTEVKRIVTLNTTGTFGEAKRIFFSEEDMDKNLQFFKVGMSCLVDEEDKVLVLLPGKAYGTIGDFLKRALADLEIPCFVEGVLKDLDEMEKLIIAEKITCIVGIPLQVQYLSRKKSKTFKKYIKKVLLSTDFVPSAFKRELTEECGCKVFNHYGMTEMGYGAAVECEALKGYHLRELDLYFEIIHPETGEPVPDGDVGEVVFTTLTRTAMPLIRYRTGDLAFFKTEACLCGTFLKTMSCVLGRGENKICLEENTFLHMSELDEVIFKNRNILDYKATFKENRLFIELLPDETMDREETVTTISTVGKMLREYLSIKGGKSIRLVLSKNKKEGTPTDITNSMIKRRIHIE